jgi:hypothetical protein
MLYRSARPKFTSDRRAIQSLTRRKEIKEITGQAKPVWLQQLLDRARLSPLVQMIESANPADKTFARRLLATLSENSSQALF